MQSEFDMNGASRHREPAMPLTPDIPVRSPKYQQSRKHEFPVCPDCGGKKTRKSRPRGFIELVILPLFFRPFRCEECDCRFLRPSPNFPFLRSQKARQSRSEEHTSELQSLRHLVC